MPTKMSMTPTMRPTRTVSSPLGQLAALFPSLSAAHRHPRRGHLDSSPRRAPCCPTHYFFGLYLSSPHSRRISNHARCYPRLARRQPPSVP